MSRDWSWIRDPNNWYWFVGADDTQVFSSATGTFVPVADATYVSWLASRTQAARIGSIDSLGSVLADLSVQPPVDDAVLTAYKSALLSRVDSVLFKVLFNHENRIRALSSQPAISAQQFIAAMRALL